MDRITTIGTIAAFCTTISFLPQVIKIRRTRHARDISLPTYIIFSFGLICWMVYGVLTASVPIVAANAITFLLCVYILVMKLIYR